MKHYRERHQYHNRYFIFRPENQSEEYQKRAGKRMWVYGLLTNRSNPMYCVIDDMGDWQGVAYPEELEGPGLTYRQVYGRG